MSDKPKQSRGLKSSSRMPEDSVFYDKVLPALFVVLGVVMIVLIAFAVGVLAGIIPWR